MPHIRITRNPGPVRIGRNHFHGHRWHHATLPQYRATSSGTYIQTRRKLHLIWAGPIFILTIPRGF